MGGELILIVEDNAEKSQARARRPGPQGYRTIARSNARPGWRWLTAEVPDLILMDVQLPAMDGISALAELRAQPRTAAIPVMA